MAASASAAHDRLDPQRAIRRWLWVVFFAIVTMVALGGITRLTGSGLSMVEWRPLMGTLPPLSDAEWQRVFERYQQSPQYAQVNTWMELADFQRIFFWEYLHRLFGRLIGLFVFVPWLYFMATKRLRGRISWRVFGALLLGGAQGLMGWLMVKSGLVDEPAVSHFRLAAHLLLAFLVAQYTLWLILDLRPRPAREEGEARARAADGDGAEARATRSADAPADRHGAEARATRGADAPADRHGAEARATRGADVGLRRGLFALLALTVVQLAFGAFMAGKRAGWLSASFPDMNGHYLPGPFFHSGNWLVESFTAPMAIHYTHRALAYLVVAAVLAFAAVAHRRELSLDTRRGTQALVLVVLAQLALGVLTVVLHVPTWLAVLHQLGGFALLSVLVFTLHASLRLTGDGSK